MYGSVGIVTRIVYLHPEKDVHVRGLEDDRLQQHIPCSDFFGYIVWTTVNVLDHLVCEQHYSAALR